MRRSRVGRVELLEDAARRSENPRRVFVRTLFAYLEARHAERRGEHDAAEQARELRERLERLAEGES